MTRDEAVTRARASLSADASEHDIVVAALPYLGIDPSTEQDGRKIEDYIRGAVILDPETFLRWHVLTDMESADGKARFHV